jgi:hypothetical protein
MLDIVANDSKIWPTAIQNLKDYGRFFRYRTDVTLGRRLYPSGVLYLQLTTAPSGCRGSLCIISAT